MKIAYIANSVVPSLTANSIQVMKMCQAFKQQGHNITLFARKGDDRVPTWEHYGVDDTFPIIFSDGINVITKNTILDAFSRKLKNYICILQTACFARSKKFDLVYTRSENIAAISSWVGIPTVLELHSPPAGRFGPLWLYLFSRSSNARLVVFITNALHSIVIKNHSFLKNIRYAIASDGIDVERFTDLPGASEARRKFEFKDAKTVGYAGHLYAGRGMELIFEISTRLPDIQFIIMGGHGKAVEEYGRIARSKDLNNIIFTGFIMNSRLQEYLACCDILLMPYQRSIAVSGGGDTAAFCSPMKLFEYMACGRVLISSDLPVFREVLNNENSLMLNPDDADLWVSAIRDIISDDGRCSALSAKIKKDSEQYSWKNRVKKILGQI